MSVSPALFLALVGLVCAGVFLVGLRFVRMAESPNSAMQIDQVHRFGRLMMFAAPAMFIAIAVLLLTGAIGPIRAAWG
jgi:hypothetical protein